MNINIVDTAVGNLNTEPQWFKWLKGVNKMNTINKKSNQPKKVEQLSTDGAELVPIKLKSINTTSYDPELKKQLLEDSIQGGSDNNTFRLNRHMHEQVSELHNKLEEINRKSRSDKHEIVCAALAALCDFQEMEFYRTRYWLKVMTEDSAPEINSENNHEFRYAIGDFFISDADASCVGIPKLCYSIMHRCAKEIEDSHNKEHLTNINN